MHPHPTPLQNKAEELAIGARLANTFENDPSLFLVCAAHAKPSANHFWGERASTDAFPAEPVLAALPAAAPPGPMATPPVQMNLRTDGTGTAGNHRCGGWSQPAKVEMLKPTTHHTSRTEHSGLNHHLGLSSEHHRSEHTFDRNALATARTQAVELTSEALPTVCQLLLL